MRSGIEVQQGEIHDIMTDRELLSDLQKYRIWKTIGFPKGWAEVSNRWVQIVVALHPIDEFYNPPLRM